KIKPIINRNMVPLREEARCEHMSNVTGSAGDQHILHRRIASVGGPILLPRLTEALNGAPTPCGFPRERHTQISQRRFLVWGVWEHFIVVARVLLQVRIELVVPRLKGSVHRASQYPHVRR